MSDSMYCPSGVPEGGHLVKDLEKERHDAKARIDALMHHWYAEIQKTLDRINDGGSVEVLMNIVRAVKGFVSIALRYAQKNSQQRKEKIGIRGEKLLPELMPPDPDIARVETDMRMLPTFRERTNGEIGGIFFELRDEAFQVLNEAGDLAHIGAVVGIFESITKPIVYSLQGINMYTQKIDEGTHKRILAIALHAFTEVSAWDDSIIKDFAGWITQVNFRVPSKIAYLVFLLFPSGKSMSNLELTQQIPPGVLPRSRRAFNDLRSVRLRGRQKAEENIEPSMPTFEIKSETDHENPSHKLYRLAVSGRDTQQQ